MYEIWTFEGVALRNREHGDNEDFRKGQILTRHNNFSVGDLRDF